MTTRTIRPPKNRVLPLLLLPVLLGVLHGCRGGAGPEWAAPPPVVEGPPFVELVRLEGPAPLDGDRVTGGAGDWLLRNERLAVVVSGAENHEGGGRILDAAPAGGRDRLLEIVPGGGMLLYDRIYHDASADTAGRTLVMHCRLAASPEVTTRITLEAGSNTVRLVTTLVNRDTGVMRGLEPNDWLRWGDDPFFPGIAGDQQSTSTPAPFACSAGDSTAYAWVGSGFQVAAGGSRLISPAAVSELAPGDSLSFERLFVVTAGSWAEASGLAWGLRDTPVGHVLARASDPHGVPVEDAVIEARDAAGTLWAKGTSSAQGLTALPVPPGRYELTGIHPHRRLRSGEGAEVVAMEVVRKTLRLSDPGRLRLAAVDERGRALPARWAALDLEAVSGGETVSGPRRRREFVTGTTEEQVLLPPGRWRLRADHGPAYQSWSEDVNLEAPRPLPLRARLESLPLPEGWLSVDLSAMVEIPPSRPGHVHITAPEAVDPREALAAGFDAAIGPRRQAGPGPPLVVPDTAFDGRRSGLMPFRLDDDPGLVERKWNVWTRELGMGLPVVALASRVYVDMNGVEADADAVVEALCAGRVQGTLGPFIEFGLEGAGPGDTVSVAAGTVRGRVRVLAPRDVDVREILIYVNDEVHAVFRVRGDETVRFDEEFEFYLTEPGGVIARVDGIPGTDPYRTGSVSARPGEESESLSQAFRPLAFTNPIRVAISGRQR